MISTKWEQCTRYRSAAAAAILLCFSMSIFGRALHAYQGRIESAARLAHEVEEALRRNEVDHALFRGFVTQVRRDFPATEAVEWSGSSIEVSNDWVLAKVNEFDQSTDLKKRLTAVVAIREYLFSVAYKLNELQAAEASSRTKNDDKQKLAEILRREEYQKPQE